MLKHFMKEEEKCNMIIVTYKGNCSIAKSSGGGEEQKATFRIIWRYFLMPSVIACTANLTPITKQKSFNVKNTNENQRTKRMSNTN